jgi:hypothetical protein
LAEAGNRTLDLSLTKLCLNRSTMSAHYVQDGFDRVHIPQARNPLLLCEVVLVSKSLTLSYSQYLHMMNIEFSTSRTPLSSTFDVET